MGIDIGKLNLDPGKATRFSEEWWEHIFLVNTIMFYKLNTDNWEAAENEKRIKEALMMNSQKLIAIEQKLNILIEKLEKYEETFDKN